MQRSPKDSFNHGYAQGSEFVSRYLGQLHLVPLEADSNPLLVTALRNEQYNLISYMGTFIRGVKFLSPAVWLVNNLPDSKLRTSIAISLNENHHRDVSLLKVQIYNASMTEPEGMSHTSHALWTHATTCLAFYDESMAHKGNNFGLKPEIILSGGQEVAGLKPLDSLQLQNVKILLASKNRANVLDGLQKYISQTLF